MSKVWKALSQKIPAKAAKRTSLSEKAGPVAGVNPPARLAVSLYVRHAGHFVLNSSVPEVLLVASLVMAQYLLNSHFSYPAEIILPIVLFGVLNTLFFYVYKYILKSPLAAHAAALPLAYGVYGFSDAYPPLRRFADMLTPDTWATPFTSAGVTLLVWGIVFGIFGFGVDRIVKRFQWLREAPLLKITLFALCFIFVVQLGRFGQRLWTIRHQLGYAYSAPDLSQNELPLSYKPNIYYLVFDRYASNETLARSYNYDNSAMTTFLASQGFVTRKNAYANYPFTTQSVSSTLAMDYHVELGSHFRDDAQGLQTAFPYRTILDRPPVVQELQRNGYMYNHLSSWWNFTRNNPIADSEPTRSFRLRVLGKQFWLTDLQRGILNKGILSPLLLKGLTIGNHTVIKYDYENDPRQNFEAQLAALHHIIDTRKEESAPQFTFAHILSPHDPYIFTETGDSPHYNGWRTDEGVDETVKYTNQLTYINGRIEELIRTLREKDPGAVIILQSDEGPYPKQFRDTSDPKQYHDPINLPVVEMQQKFGILASYYMPGISPEAVQKEIGSSVNSFRFVLDKYLGYDLEKLPDCQFTAGNKYYMYKYTLVTGALTGVQDPEACKKYE